MREWVERDTNLGLIRMMGCLAASTLTGDAVELVSRLVEGYAADIPFDELGKVGMGGFVLFSMVIGFVLTMMLVPLVWRLVWVPVLIVVDGLPQVAAQNFSKRCAEDRGRSSAVNRKGFGHIIRETALDVHGSNRRLNIFSVSLKDSLYLGFGIVRKIGFRLFLKGFWEASTVPDLVFQFMDNPRSGRLGADISGNGSFQPPGDRAKIHRDTEAQPRQMEHSDAPIAGSPNPNESEMDEWGIEEDSVGKDEDPSAASAAPSLAARLVSVFYYLPKEIGMERDAD